MAILTSHVPGAQLDYYTLGQRPAFRHTVIGQNAAGAAGDGAWDVSAAYSGWIAAAVAVRIKAGGNDADAGDGAGGRTITVYGLDANYALVNATISTHATDGTAAGAASTQTFLRVFDLVLASAGSNGTNTAVMTVENTTPVDLGHIPVAVSGSLKNRSHNGIYTVPAGHVAIARRMAVNGSAALPTFAGLIARPFGGLWQDVWQIGSTANDVLCWPPAGVDAPVLFDAKTDIELQLAGTGNGRVMLQLDLYVANSTGTWG